MLIHQRIHCTLYWIARSLLATWSPLPSLGLHLMKYPHSLARMGGEKPVHMQAYIVYSCIIISIKYYVGGLETDPYQEPVDALKS
jgi:hypothetical protein